MPQEFNVVRCFRCQTFQAQQVKKTPRWNCKMCGEKQSLLKVFGQGSGRECRLHVQKLNTERGAVMDQPEPSPCHDVEEQVSCAGAGGQSSHWSRYLDSPVPQVEGEQRKETGAPTCARLEVGHLTPGGRSLLPANSLFDSGDDFSHDL